MATTNPASFGSSDFSRIPSTNPPANSFVRKQIEAGINPPPSDSFNSSGLNGNAPAGSRSFAQTALKLVELLAAGDIEGATQFVLSQVQGSYLDSNYTAVSNFQGTQFGGIPLGNRYTDVFSASIDLDFKNELLRSKGQVWVDLIRTIIRNPDYVAVLLSQSTGQPQENFKQQSKQIYDKVLANGGASISAVTTAITARVSEQINSDKQNSDFIKTQSGNLKSQLGESLNGFGASKGG